MKDNTVLLHILKGLVPYTKENLALTYKPNKFFNDLERLSKQRTGRQIGRTTIKTTYYRARRRGYIQTDEGDKSPRLTEKGTRELKLYSPNRLKDAKLLVTFDIKEQDRHKRTELRQLLRILKFKQIQRSVWISEYDAAQILKQEIARLNIKKDVILYEAFKIS